MTTETEKEETSSNDNSGLVAKNKELLGKLKKQQDTLDQLLADKEAAEATAAEKAGDWEKLKSQLEAKHKKEVDGLKAQLETASNDLRTIRVDNEIAQIIAKSGVTAAHVPAVEALMLRKVEYADGQASIDGKSVSDWAKDYFAKDGAIYRPAPDNSGAGASSNDGSKASQYRIPTSAADVGADLIALSRTNPEEYNSVMDKAGLHNLKV